VHYFLVHVVHGLSGIYTSKGMVQIAATFRTYAYA